MVQETTVSDVTVISRTDANRDFRAAIELDIDCGGDICVTILPDPRDQKFNQADIPYEYWMY
jgi:hypothetical protein